MFVNCVCFVFFSTYKFVFVSFFFNLYVCVCFMRLFVFLSYEFQMIIDIHNAENLAK